MGTPFQFRVELLLPELFPDPLLFGFADTYDSKADFEFNFPDSSGTKVVDFGTMPEAGAKVVLVSYAFLADAPGLLIELNPGEGSIPAPVPTGGFLAIGSPSPDAGITSMTISYTGAGKVKVWLLG